MKKDLTYYDEVQGAYLPKVACRAQRLAWARAALAAEGMPMPNSDELTMALGLLRTAVANHFEQKKDRVAALKAVIALEKVR